VSVAVRLTELKQKREEHRQKGIRQSNEIRLQHGQDVAQVAGKPHCRVSVSPRVSANVSLNVSESENVF